MAKKGRPFKDNPQPNAYRWRARQIYQVEKTCNRCDGPGQVIHHVSHDVTDNRLENLETLCRRCHQRHHHTTATRTSPCVECGTIIPYSDHNVAKFKRQYCSISCARRGAWKRPGYRGRWGEYTPPEVACLTCGKMFRPRKNGPLKYCSKACYGISRRKP